VIFSLVHSLIRTGDLMLDNAPALRIADILMPETEIDVNVEEEELEKPDDPEEPPPELPPEQQEFDVENQNVNFGVQIRPDVQINRGFGVGSADGEYVPIVKVAPIYPSLAQRRGIEGECLVEYSVTTTGAVRDPVALECTPKGMFERASIRAALKFKYKPRVIDGKPAEVTGVRNLFTYRLED